MNQPPLQSRIMRLDPAELNAVCRSKPKLPNQTDSNAALLSYFIRQLDSAHEWCGVWNGPNLITSIHRHGSEVQYLGASGSFPS